MLENPLCQIHKNLGSSQVNAKTLLLLFYFSFLFVSTHYIILKINLRRILIIIVECRKKEVDFVELKIIKIGEIIEKSSYFSGYCHVHTGSTQNYARSDRWYCYG